MASEEEDVLLVVSPLVGWVEVLSCVMMEYAEAFLLCLKRLRSQAETHIAMCGGQEI